ncbi:MAG: histidine phosphatase family protein [Planctomycetes bacterium]|nr:histidine phosphatase family protein [Planctomycetota bacterium]
MNSLNGPFDRPPSAPVSRVFLIRHGATEANECRPFVLQGCEIDGPLTTGGRQQAAALTRFLANVELGAIYASPMQRAMETVAEIAQSRSLKIQSVPELRECHVGEWAGLSWNEIHQRDHELCEQFLADPAQVKHPGGESYLDLQARVVPAFNVILNRHPGLNVLVMAHNMVNRVLLASLFGIDLRLARRIRQQNCCINVLHHNGDETEVVTMNSAWHLSED